MSENIFHIIRAQEEKAAALLQDAQHSANEIVKNAEARASEDERKAAVDNRALFQRTLDERRQAVTQRLETGKADDIAAQQAALQAAREQMDKAVQMIVNEVLNGAR